MWCSRKHISQSWLTVSKNDRTSASRMWFTLVLTIPTQRASGASCGPRPGRNQQLKPRKSSSSIAFSISTTARWTILSSTDAIAGGRCRPSTFGMNRRRAGWARYDPRWTRSCRSRSRGSRSASSSRHVTPSTPAAAPCIIGFGPSPSRGGPDGLWPDERSPGSRTRSFSCRPGSLTTPGRGEARESAPACCLPPP